MKSIISASILSANFSHLEKEIHACEDAGVDWIHVDVMDGHFVPNITMGQIIVENVRRMTFLPIDVHLMIEKPERHVASFISAGADFLSVHQEGNPNVYRTLQVIGETQCKAALALNPGTSIQAAEPLLRLVDFVLLMSVNPGFSGQKFIEDTPQRVQELSRLIEKVNPDCRIEIDGGVNGVNAPILTAAGASILVAATSIFKHPGGIAAGVRELKQNAA